MRKSKIYLRLSKILGFSLIELIFVLLIISVFTYFAVPNFSSIVRSYESSQIIRKLQRSFEIARTEAITNKKHVVVCPLNSNNSCVNQWSSGWRVFIDDNNDKSLDIGETLLLNYGKLPDSSYISISGFGSSSRYISFTPTGNSLTNATVTYCPSYNDANLIRSIILNKQGRSRLGLDTNDDGTIDEARCN